MYKTSPPKRDPKRYWFDVAEQIVSEEARKSRKDRIKICDYTVTLPLELKKRVEKIIPYEFEEYDRKVFMDDIVDFDIVNDISKDFKRDVMFDSDEEQIIIESEEEEKEIEFAESKCSVIERMEHDFVNFDLKLHKPIEFAEKKKKKVNWCSTYLCKKRKERIKWDSKIYHLGVSMAEKTLDEQADVLIEAAAERFSKWLSSLGANKQTDISKETLKNLFAVGTDRMLFASLMTEPKELKAIAKAVADVWNLPNMALELKYEEYIQKRLKKRPKHIHNVVFGRTVPPALRPWVPSKHDEVIKTVFPNELLTGEKIFKGLKHLRSTKALVEFYRKHPNFKTPAFFKRQNISHRNSGQISTQHIPLYDKLKLVY